MHCGLQLFLYETYVINTIKQIISLMSYKNTKIGNSYIKDGVREMGEICRHSAKGCIPHVSYMREKTQTCFSQAFNGKNIF